MTLPIFCKTLTRMNCAFPVVALLSSAVLAVALAVLLVPFVTAAPLVTAATLIAGLSAFVLCIAIGGSIFAICNVWSYSKSLSSNSEQF